MFGRRFGRLLGSLFVLAAFVGGAAGLVGDGSTGGAVLVDITWN
ncbi:hypothetical protein GA0070622_1269 [Micromonospora sediminicola]|uniref:Uncharacterized protein n=1 Tax=Micromonospora sediminicola TaxID=946078 RepID=A0A1A9B5F4_9ACTN|nr:hypothetical protein GA0070622_1269 [Micromonospora sediminicola]